MKHLIALLLTLSCYFANASLITLNCENSNDDDAAINLGLTFTKNMSEGSVSVASKSALAVYKLKKTGELTYEAMTGMALLKIGVSKPRKEDGYTEYDVTLAYEGEDSTDEVDKFVCSSVEW